MASSYRTVVGGSDAAIEVVGARSHVEVPRRVGHVGGERAHHRGLRQRGAFVWNSAVARLDPDQPAERRRDARRAAAVTRGAERDEARSHRRGRAAAGTARRALEVPRVSGRSPCLGVRERGAPELGRRRLADGNRAGSAQAPDVDGVGLDRWTTLEEQRALRRRHARAVLEILHAERDAGQRARVVAPRNRGIDGFGGAVGEVGIEMDEGVERLVVSIDGSQALVEHLDRLHLAPADGLSRLDDGVHARILPRLPRTSTSAWPIPSAAPDLAVRRPLGRAPRRSARAPTTAPRAHH